MYNEPDTIDNNEYNILTMLILHGCTPEEKQESDDDYAKSLFSGDNHKIRS